MNRRFCAYSFVGIAMVLAVASTSSTVSAQAPVPASPNGSDKPGRFSGIGETLGKAFDAPVHPVVQGVASGGGIGGGIGYDHPSTGPWHLSSKAVATIHRYWLLEFDTGYSG